MFRILVVDDEKENLHAIERIFFDECDCELQFSDNGQEALQLAEDIRPDLILLDIMMPGMDGYEVCRKVKAEGRNGDIKVLFLSGRSSVDDRLKGYATLADDFVTKPYDAQELRAKVRILLRLKQAQDELRESNRNLERIIEQRTRELVVKERQALVGRMVQGIVHNLQNPLMAASGFSQLARKNLGLLDPLPEKLTLKQREAVEKAGMSVGKVLEALNRVQTLIDNLLQKGRKDANVQYQKINLNDLITAEVQFFEADMEFKHKIVKELQLDPSLPECRGIYADFSQIFGNIIKNAVDAIRHSAVKKITIATRHDAKNIFIDFTDTGMGITPQDKPHIFEPFFSTKVLKGEGEDEPAGTGLGLHTCQQLITSYHGAITVSSDPHVGTTFTVSLPYVRVPEGALISEE